MIKNGVRIVIILILLLPSLCFAAEEKRIALVIGISNYQFAGQLPHTANDAKAVSEIFRKFGFEVDSRYDVDYRELATAVRDFGVKAADADVAVFYYAGHGIQV